MSYKQLNKAAKSQWLKLLRSGEFKQTEGTLKDKKGYCCLGVAQVAYCRAAGIKPAFESGIGMLTSENGRNKGQSFGTVHWLGLSKRAENKLAELNDRAGLSFKEIATWIKKNL